LSSDATPRRALGEALWAFAGTTAVCAALWQGRSALKNLPGYLSFLGDASTLIALVFLAVPWWLLERRRADWSAYALTWRPAGPGVLLALGAAAVLFPLFYLGFHLYYRTVCDAGAFAEMCQRFRGAGGGALRFSPKLLEDTLAQVVAVALPEEFFFRGYLQGRLAEAWPARRHCWGAPVGRALVVTAALFALGHLLVDGNPLGLAVFFPGLVFGWMREKTGSILAGTLFHALCNLYSDVLHRSFFG